MDDAHGFHCSNMQLEQCQMVVCKFIAAVQYMYVLRQLRRGFYTIVLHCDCSYLYRHVSILIFQMHGAMHVAACSRYTIIRRYILYSYGHRLVTNLVGYCDPSYLHWQAVSVFQMVQCMLQLPILSYKVRPLINR